MDGKTAIGGETPSGEGITIGVTGGGVASAGFARFASGVDFFAAGFAAATAGFAGADFFVRRFRRARAASSFFNFSTALRAFFAAFLESLYFCLALLSVSLASFACFLEDSACFSARPISSRSFCRAGAAGREGFLFIGFDDV